MAATTHLLTVDEFLELPEERGLRQELFHGEVIALPPPKLKHSVIQRNLWRALGALADPGSFVTIDVGYRPLPEHEFWIADVAYLSAERFRQADPKGNIRGAPELVIEVLSPSNTAEEMYEKEQICLAKGSKEFWVVDPKRRSVRVTTQDGRTKTYGEGREVPLNVLGTPAMLSVDEVFLY